MSVHACACVHVMLLVCVHAFEANPMPNALCLELLVVGLSGRVPTLVRVIALYFW